MFPKVRWRIRTLLVAVAISAVVMIWVKVNYRDWQESFHQWQVNRQVWRQLDRRVTLSYPKGLTLQQLLTQIKTQTITTVSPAGLTVYVDPEGLEDANQDLTKIVTIDAQSIPVKDALESVLKPLGLRIYVHDGVVSLTAVNDDLP